MKKIFNIEKQVYLFQIFGIIITIFVCMVISVSFIIAKNNKNQEENLLKTGKIIAGSSIVIDALEDDKNNEYINNYLDIYIKSIANLDYLAVCDLKNLCIYYPNKSFVGRIVNFDVDKKAIENNSHYIENIDRKFYKLKVAYVPVTDNVNNVIGYIALSIFDYGSGNDISYLLYIYMAISSITAFLGIFISISIRRKTRKALKGRNIEEFQRLSQEKDEVLDSLDEAIVAINLKGEIIMVNKAFLEMLGYDGKENLGAKLEEIFPETELIKILNTGTAQYNISVNINGNEYVSSRIPVYEKGKLIGAASISRNVTEVRKLAEELSGANKMVDSLRTFNHEFMNKLHVILGYLETKNPNEAKKFIIDNVNASSENVSKVAREIESTGIAAIIIGKMISAGKYGIKLELMPDSYCKNLTAGISFDFYVTIIGNLLENAIEELRECQQEYKQIDIGLFIDEKYTVISVTDTGRGMSDEVKSHIFEKGFSTKGTKRGTGLFIVGELVEKYGGTIEVDTEVSEGTSITVTLESIL